jgi:pilus assembly protein CpaC
MDMRRNSQAPRFSGLLQAVAWVCIIAVLGSGTVQAQVVERAQAMPEGSSSSIVDPAATPVTLLVGRSAVVDLDRPITRVSLTSADVADALVTSSNQLLVHGKTPGTISMFVWERAGGMRRFEITVQRDMVALDRQLAQLFPGEAIQAQGSGRQIVLSGKVSRKDLVDRAIDVASGFVGKRDDVISLLQVQEGPRSNQVMLRVRFAEVSRSALTELGMSLFTSPAGVSNTVGRVTTQQFPAPVYEGDKLTFSDFLNFFVLSKKHDLGLLVRALQTRGLFESLAEPNLVAESGKEASFLAGGEFPIPVAQGSGANIGVSVQFKEFGVRLAFTPTVVGDRVHLKVRPEVSTLDFANAVTLGGFRIPALTTRRTETELELQNGQTFAIAGLMNNSMTEQLSKVPGIGDIPVLGYLFRSKAARKEQTELIVMITPQILDTNSPGVTSELPRLQEPFLPAVPERETVPMPAPAFTEPRTPGAAAVPPSSKLPEQRAVTAEQRKSMEQARRAERAAAERAEKADKEERASREAELRTKVAEVKAWEKQGKAAAEARKAEEQRQAKLAEAERQRQEKLAREAAKRDAEAAMRRAEADRRAVEEARRQAEAERRRQAAIEEAAAKLKAAQEEYRAQLAQEGTR